MGVVRIDDKLLEEIKDWIKKNGNKYKVPNVTAFINSAIYDKLQEINNKNKRSK